MGNIDFEKKAEEIKKNVAQNQMESGEKKFISQKICPFMSTPDADRACTPQCKLYRANKKNYECYFMALQTISWYADPNHRSEK